MDNILRKVEIDFDRIGFSVGSKIGGQIDYYLIIICFFFWAMALFLIKYSIQTFLFIFCSTISSSHAKLPVENWRQKPGAMGEWGTKVVKDASMSELERFLVFRRVTPKTDSQGRVFRKELEKLATTEVVNYKSECVDFGSRTYNHEVFTRGNKSYPRFEPPPHWNGWQGFWAEMGNYGQNLFSGNLAYAIEHGTVGMLAAYFLFSYNVFAFKLAMYLDLGFNLVDLLLMSVSFLIQKDVTFYSGFGNIFGTTGTFKLLLLHHLAACALEYLVLAVGDNVHFAEVACHLMVALVGTTVRTWARRREDKVEDGEGRGSASRKNKKSLLYSACLLINI